MWNKIQSNLALKVASYTVLSAMILGLFVSTYQTWYHYKDRNQHVEESLNALISTTLPSISLATYNFNSQLNKQLTQGLITHPDIISASIIDSKGSELSIAKSGVNCIPSTMGVILHGSNSRYEYPLTHKELPLGKLILELNTCNKSDQFINDAINSLISNLTLSILIALFIYVIFYRLVSAPISRLIGRLNSMDPNAIEYASLTHLKAHRPDELGTLVERFAELLRTIHDHISRLKSAEKTINTYSANLEELVSKRTNALSQINRQLKQSNAELENSRQTSEQLNNTKFNLLSSLSQEFTLPLNKVIGEISTLDDTQFKQTTALKKCAQLLSILDELDDIIMLRSDNYTQRCPIHLRSVFNTIIERINTNAQFANALMVKFDDSVSDSHIADSDQIQQLMLNLVGNVLRYTPHNKATICISENSRGVLFTITAQQLKIPASDFERILLTDEIKTDSPPLTCMGLALGKDLIDVIGGSIHLTENSQAESELLIELPLPSSDQQLQEIAHRLPDQQFRVDIENTRSSEKVCHLLQEWNLPFHITSRQSGMPTFIITDHVNIESDAWFIVGIGSEFERQSSINNTPVIAISDAINKGEFYEALRAGCARESEQGLITRKPKVLVVEDNTINRMLSQRFLKNLNCEIEIAEDGNQAVRLANRAVYDLIFMDCQMPVMDGFMATRQIRRSPLNQSTPIVALTGLDSENERQACLQAGMNDFITKPFSQDQLASALIQWLPQEDQDE